MDLIIFSLKLSYITFSFPVYSILNATGPFWVLLACGQFPVGIWKLFIFPRIIFYISPYHHLYRGRDYFLGMGTFKIVGLKNILYENCLKEHKLPGLGNKNELGRSITAAFKYVGDKMDLFCLAPESRTRISGCKLPRGNFNLI